MADIEALRKKASEIGQRLKKAASSKDSIFVAGRPDADGLATVAIICKSIFANNGIFHARFMNVLEKDELEKLSEENYSHYVFCELAGGKERQIFEVLGDKAIFIGHHNPQGDSDSFLSLNANTFGFDGSKEVSSSGLAYLISREMLPHPDSAAWLSLIGALGDRQDVGSKRSLIGLNELFLQDALNSSQVEVAEELLLFGRDVKALHEAIAYTTDPFIQGLTGNKDVCLSVLTSAKLELKKSSRWRVSSDLSNEERDKLLLTLTSYLQVTGDSISSVVGTVYLLKREDEHSFLKDARDFALLLDASGRMGRPGSGLSVCLGDRGKALTEAEKLLIDYKNQILRSIKVILSDEERLTFSDSVAVVGAEGLVDEQMAGALANALTVVPRVREKVIVLRVTTRDGMVKFSVRKGSACSLDVDVGQVVRKVSLQCDGEGGGHRTMAGARVSSVKASEFVERLRKEVKS
ncbi:MAG: DHH family phosphoesterase [Conexivisphaerales archaeon]